MVLYEYYIHIPYGLCIILLMHSLDLIDIIFFPPERHETCAYRIVFHELLSFCLHLCQSRLIVSLQDVGKGGVLHSAHCF